MELSFQWRLRNLAKFHNSRAHHPLLFETLNTNLKRNGLDMKLTTLIAALAVAALAPVSALAGDIVINDAYARASSPAAKAGAAFMQIVNNGDADDRLIAAETDVAVKVELHTHIKDGDVMQMRPIEGGIVLPAGGEHWLKRGGDHVMMMGLKEPLLDGKEILVTLIFEKSEPVTITIPVDLER